jgi:sugar (pentulose or hexulose) kinase
VEIEPEAYWLALESTAGRLVAKHPEVESLWLCSEMHGVIVADWEGVPLSPYISWRDGRGTVTSNGDPSTYDKLLAQRDAFFALSGMKLRPGLPIVSLSHLASQSALPKGDLMLFTLVDWLLWRGGERYPAIHASLAAGTGFYDVHRQLWSEALFGLASLTDRKIRMATIAPAGTPIGRIDLAGRKITVFGGVGDLQAAVFGAGFPGRVTMAINLGTGSQVLRACNNQLMGIERRPGADGGEFAAITHIPSGRALNVFATCLDGCAQLGGGQPFFWRLFGSLSTEQVLQAPMQVDMNVFAAAWKYERGGSIRFIHEGGFTPDELLAAIARGWLAQYATAMELLDPEREESAFLVSGGLGRRAEFVSPVLSALSGREARPVGTLTGEETLDGLLALARSCDLVN